MNAAKHSRYDNGTRAAFLAWTVSVNVAVISACRCGVLYVCEHAFPRKQDDIDE